jgi:hypothetical protein
MQNASTNYSGKPSNIPYSFINQKDKHNNFTTAKKAAVKLISQMRLTFQSTTFSCIFDVEY